MESEPWEPGASTVRAASETGSEVGIVHSDSHLRMLGLRHTLLAWREYSWSPDTTKKLRGAFRWQESSPSRKTTASCLSQKTAP